MMRDGVYVLQEKVRKKANIAETILETQSIEQTNEWDGRDFQILQHRLQIDLS